MGILDTFKKTKATSKTATSRGEDLQSAKVQKEVVVEKKKTAVSKPKAEKKSSEKTETPDVLSTSHALDISQVLISPIVSEKSARAGSTGTYVFAVKKTATKVDIANAVRAIYGHLPVSVRVLHTEGKTARFGKTSGSRSDWKKAYVTMKKGTTLQVHAGV